MKWSIHSDIVDDRQIELVKRLMNMWERRPLDVLHEYSRDVSNQRLNHEMWH